MKRIPPITVGFSANRKLVSHRNVRTRGKPRAEALSGIVVTTSLPVRQTCPETCPQKNSSCYAQTGFMKFATWRREKLAEEGGWSPDEIIQAEVDAVKARFPNPRGLLLRLHDGGGDVTTDEQARQLAALADWWIDHGGLGVWTYTHSWKTVDRHSWGRVSVLASVHDATEIRDAAERGYAVAAVVPAHPPDGRAYAVPGTDTRLIPCPAQTRFRSCEECKLCLDDGRLRSAQAGIAFREHGNVYRIRARPTEA